MHRSQKYAAAALLLALTLLTQGCSLGYTSLKPGENAAIYAPLFADTLAAHGDATHWVWVRGTTTGDLDGNGTTDEELVLATIQQGTEKNPGPIEAAHLAAVRVDKEGNRSLIDRRLLFDASPVPDAPKPRNDLGVEEDRLFTRCRMMMVRDKETLVDTVVVYFWSEPTPSNAWYVGFALTENSLRKNLETAMRQTMPGVLATNLDKRIEASAYGYQLLFSAAAIPEETAAKLGAPGEMPLWGHVFERNGDVMTGTYEQADERFAENYRKELEPAWNRMYLKAVLKGLPPEELAWFEYHLALLNRYTGDDEMARGFLEKAASGAKDPVLLRALESAAHAPSL